MVAWRGSPRVLWALLLHPLLAARPHVNLEASDTNGEPDASRNMTFQPGVLGTCWIGVQGRVDTVFHGTQADENGMRVNDYITGVNGKNYGLSGFLHVFTLKKSYTLTVLTPPDWVIVLHSTFQRMSVPAAAAGCLLFLASPWFVYQATQGPLKLYPSAVHLLISLVMGHAIGRWADTMFCTLYSGHATVAVVGDAFGIGLGLTGLVLGCFFYMHNPLVANKLGDDLAPELQKVNLLASMLCVGAVLCQVVSLWYAWTRYAQSLASNAPTLLYPLREVPTSFAILVLTLLLTRISLAVRQAFRDVAQGLPCKEHEFTAAVHAPCAEVLGDVRRKLQGCGTPLLLLLASILSQGFGLYTLIITFLFSKGAENRGDLFYQMEISHWALQLLAGYVAISVPLAQMTKGEKELRRELRKARELDSDLHVKVQALEAFLDEPKIGFPLWGDLDLTWSLMLSFTLRTLLAGMVIKTFFDSQLGLEEAIEESEGAQQAQLTILQENLTQLAKLQAELTHLWKNVSPVGNHS